jgi:hypothetical protein
MGMFDNIEVDAILPELPQNMKSFLVKQRLAFQTKDTPNQAMSTYKIDDAGKLWVQKAEGHWEEGKPVAEDASISEKLAAMGRFVTDKEWWEEENFTGAINFYDSINHPEFYECELASQSNEWMRFEYGWIEFQALFDKGKLVRDIELIEYKEPKKLSDEELEERNSKQKQNRQEIETSMRKHRKETPTIEQKLIDNIDRECKLVETIMDETDISLAISNIRLLISEYRKKHDPWY